ncbi:TPA: hypothetical protein ACH3X1_006028 [Trebouxia sp. C0004]
MQDEAVAHFVLVTGADAKTAEGLIEACNGDLESAIQLYFDTQAGSAHHSDEALARSLQQHTSSAQDGPSDLSAEIRAPIPIMKDTLYGEGAQHMLRHHSKSRISERSSAQDVNAFRDFQAEGRGPSGATSSSGLASLFKAPSALMFQGTIDEAKAKAVQEGKWLMVNVQSNSEFASHQLNRDTWSDPTVSSILLGSFVFWQVTDSSDMGSRFMTSYRIDSVTELPVTLILDPITGAKQRQFLGFIEPQRPANNKETSSLPRRLRSLPSADFRLAEDLVPFMDHDIHHPSAHKLATQHKRKQTQHQPPSKKVMTEEDELRMALAMSVEGISQPQASTSAPANVTAQAPAAASGPAPVPSSPAKASHNGMRERENASAIANGAAHQAPDEASVIADAKARLPSEPGSSDPNGCRIAIRLPSGDRLTRTFSKTDSVSALADYCMSEAPGAANRPFKLMQAFPGDAWLSTSLLHDAVSIQSPTHTLSLPFIASSIPLFSLQGACLSQESDAYSSSPT